MTPILQRRLRLGFAGALVLVSVCGACGREPEPEPEPNPEIEIEIGAVPADESAAPTSRYVDGDAARTRPDADVLFVRALQEGPETWRFEVTLAHPDKDASDYADGWDVVLPDGTVVAGEGDASFTQAISSPSVGAQPVERSQAGLTIPETVDRVLVRAHDRARGFGGREVTIYLNQARGPGFEVSRTH